MCFARIAFLFHYHFYSYCACDMSLSETKTKMRTMKSHIWTTFIPRASCFEPSKLSQIWCSCHMTTLQRGSTFQPYVPSSFTRASAEICSRPQYHTYSLPQIIMLRTSFVRVARPATRSFSTSLRVMAEGDTAGMYVTFATALPS